ncbi:hypothetical protein BH11PSE12_BH11PSE12_07740 [soil metagenome]
MKLHLLALLLSLVLPVASAATATAESVESLLEITKAKDLVDGTNANIESSMRQGMLAALADSKLSKLSEEQTKVIDLLPKKLLAAMQLEFNWEVLKPDFIRLYAETLSQDEVDGMIQFYKTPLGQALIAKMPLIQKRCLAITQARLSNAITKIQAAVASAIAEVKGKQ